MRIGFRLLGVSSRLWPLLLTAYTVACTSAAPWGAQGTADHPCFREGTCDRGLVCLNGICSTVSELDTTATLAPGLSPSCPLVSSPVLTDVPEVTPHLRVALHGEVDPSATSIVISNGTETQVVTASAGSFCGEMSIVANQLTTFEVIAVTADGCASPAASASVTQREATGNNVLVGLPAFTSGNLVGSAAALTDNNISSSLQLSFRDHSQPGDACDNAIYAWFALPQRETINRLEVIYPPTGVGRNYLRCWALLANDNDDPGVEQPAIGVGGWYSIGGSQTSTSSSFHLEIAPRSVAQLALLMFEDGDSESEQERFDIAEIRAYNPITVEPFQGCPTP